MSTTVISFFLVFLVSYGCQYPTGLGTNVGEVDFSRVNFTQSISQLISLGSDERQLHEPAIENREIAWQYITRWNTEVQPYSPVALEFFARRDISEERRFCNDSDPTLLEQHRIIAAYYNLYFSSIFLYPRAKTFRDFFILTNLDPDICDDPNFNCSDISTPWGLASVAAEEVLEFSTYDGFNSFGTYNRKINPIPYQDYRDNPYVPKNDPWILKDDERWQPLLESNNVGFLYNQEHVVPHIGFTGTTFFLSDDYYCSLSVPDPEYNYELEIDLVLERMSNLNDTKKMLIERFDNKRLSLNALRSQYRSAIGLRDNYFPDRLGTTMFLILVHEASVVVWRHKVLYDLIRPTTLIQNLLKDEEITTYGGTDIFGDPLGTQTFLGNDFEAYIRTMPHSEYPSGSACLCKAVAVGLNRFYEYIGQDLDFETDLASIGGKLFFDFPAKSSTREPNSTPQNDIRVEFSSWDEIAQVCSQSRLDGGMHFTASITSGEELCADIGNVVFEGMRDLLEGVQPAYVVDINDRTIRQDRCGDFANDSDSDSDSDDSDDSDSNSDDSDDNGNQKGKGKGKGGF